MTDSTNQANIGAFCVVLLASKPYHCSTLSHISPPNLGLHLQDVPISDLTDHFLRLNLIFLALWATSTLLVKATLLVPYLRILRAVLYLHWVIYIRIGIVSAFYLSTLIADVVKCAPTPAGPGRLASQQICRPAARDISVAPGVFGLVSGLAILMIPMVMAVPLKLSRGRSVAVYGILLDGFPVSCGVLFDLSRGKPIHRSPGRAPRQFLSPYLAIAHEFAPL